MSDLFAAMTGFSNALTKYVDFGTQVKMDQVKTTRETEAKRGLMHEQTQLDLSKMSLTETYKLSLEGKVDADTAAATHPQAAKIVDRFFETNKRAPTVAEFNTLIKTLPDEKKKLTGAEGAVDRDFAKEYVKYVASGGYADTIGQIQTLEGVLEDLKSGKKNLTGPLVGSGEGAIMGLPRKVLAPGSVAAQQAVEQSIQRSLKLTLGGQFTEREGQLFMRRGYDPQLTEKENIPKLQRAVAALKSMALAKQRAVDYYEDNGTLKGFKGEFYTLKEGVISKATKEDFYAMIGENPDKPTSNKETDPAGLGI